MAIGAMHRRNVISRYELSVLTAPVGRVVWRYTNSLDETERDGRSRGPWFDSGECAQMRCIEWSDDCAAVSFGVEDGKRIVVDLTQTPPLAVFE